ncbi:hypothetical protein C5167_038563 [Papaver somniferum]|uniref:Uncharacterized protein n=1 Tax=Papaver somniferum TaxID=3469 RepID=A0A4Y7IDP6_PAPSO|nr:hypothetical protein C5167_038563 [Papaver somniferum]
MFFSHHEFLSVEASRNLKSSTSRDSKKLECSMQKCTTTVGITATTTDVERDTLIDVSDMNTKRVVTQAMEDAVKDTMVLITRRMSSNQVQYRRDLTSTMTNDGSGTGDNSGIRNVEADYKEKEFRPTTPGHSPGVGHSAKTPKN